MNGEKEIGNYKLLAILKIETEDIGKLHTTYSYKQ